MAVKRGPNPAGRQGKAKQVNEKYLFGTAAEIANRTDTGYDHPPEQNVPSFNQIRPGNSGKDVNTAGRALRSGNLKFSRGPR